MIEVDQQHADRPVALDLLLQQSLGIGQEGATIEQAGQRIDHRGGLVAQLGALLRHREQDERGRDRHQESFKAQHVDPGARQDVVAFTAMQKRVERRAQDEHRAMRREQHDRGPARHQRLAAAAPEFIRGEPGVGRDDHRGELAALPRRSRSPAIGRRAARRRRRRSAIPATMRGR